MKSRAARIAVEPVLEPTPEAAARLRRLRRMAWWMDRCVPLGGRWRIGLDPIVGLVPGVGDTLTTGLSLWMLYEAMRLGLPWRVLARMIGNIAVEATFGAVPVFGDLFDAAWQANQRNFALVETHYSPRLRARSSRRIAVAFALIALLFLGGLLAALVLVTKAFLYLVNL